MTLRPILATGEGSAPRGLCEAPQQAVRWTQGLTVPAQCFRVEVVVHQSQQQDVWCYAFEVTDPHTKELLAKWVEPARPANRVLPLASLVTVELRAALLALTDPDPF